MYKQRDKERGNFFIVKNGDLYIYIYTVENHNLNMFSLWPKKNMFSLTKLQYSYRPLYIYNDNDT
jgi:hypothetical protein